jgi:hypothetical protein
MVEINRNEQDYSAAARQGEKRKIKTAPHKRIRTVLGAEKKEQKEQIAEIVTQITYRKTAVQVF